ncbi:MAG: 2,3-diketo-L-gulonate-binding periplasmic protein YiaO [Desulfovibrio sp.]
MLKSMKRLTTLFCSAALLLAVGATAQAAPLTLKMSHPQPPTHVYHRAAEVLDAELQKLSNKTMKLEIYPSSLLGGEKTVIDLVQVGTVDMIVTSTPLLTNYDDNYKMFTLPFLFDNLPHLYATFDKKDVTDSLSSSLVQKKGLRPIGFWIAGPRNVVTTKPIEKLEDFKGMKIRSMQDALLLASYSAFGANPVPMPFPDVFTAMQAGTIHGTEASLNTYIDNRFYEVAKNVAMMDIHYFALALCVSERSWKKLTDQQKEWLQQAAVVASAFERAEMEKEIDAIPAKLVELKVNVTNPDKAELKKASEKVYTDFFKEYPQVKPLVDKIRTW